MAAVSHFEDNPSFTWPCPLTQARKRSAHSTCAKKFAEDHGFQLVESSNDGNCFFYTLTEFGKRSGYEPLRLHPKKHDNAMELRKQLVNYIESHFEEYAHYLVHNNNNNGNNWNNGNNGNNGNNSNDIYGQIQKLRRNGAWASNIGDLVPMVAPHAFGIHINLYNIEVGDDSDIIRLMPIRSNLPTTVFVSIIRVRQGHFQLLWPRSGVYTSIQDPIKSLSINRRKNRSDILHHNTASNDIVRAAKLSVEAAKIAVDTAKKTTSPSSSLSKNEQKLNQMIQDLNQLSMGSMRRSTRSTRSSTGPLSTYGNRPPSPPKQSTTRRTSKRGSTAPSSASYLNNNNALRNALK